MIVKFRGRDLPPTEKDNHRADASTSIEAASDVEAPIIPIQAAGFFVVVVRGRKREAMCFCGGLGGEEGMVLFG